MTSVDTQRIGSTHARAIIAVVVAAIAVAAVVMAIQLAPRSPSPNVGAPKITVHGAFGDGLSSGPGVSLAAALGRINRHVPLPDTNIVGAAQKAGVDDMELKGTTPETYGLLVQYASGIEYKVIPGSIDLAKLLTTGNSVKSSDGGVHSPELMTIGGHDALAVTGGTQLLGSGGYAVKSFVVWNDQGFTYHLEADPAVVPVATLIRAAESVR